MQWLSEHPQLTELLKNNAIYPLEAGADRKFPCLVYSKDTAERSKGVSTDCSADPLVFETWNFQIIADTYSELDVIRNRLTSSSFNGYRGPVKTAFLQAMFVEEDQDDRGREPDGDEQSIPFCNLKFKLRYLQSEAT